MDRAACPAGHYYYILRKRRRDALESAPKPDIPADLSTGDFPQTTGETSAGTDNSRPTVKTTTPRALGSGFAGLGSQRRMILGSGFMPLSATRVGLLASANNGATSVMSNRESFNLGGTRKAGARTIPAEVADIILTFAGAMSLRTAAKFSLVSERVYNIMQPLLYSRIVLLTEQQTTAFLKVRRTFHIMRPSSPAATTRTLHLGAGALCSTPATATQQFWSLLVTCKDPVSLTVTPTLLFAGREHISCLFEDARLHTLSLSTGTYPFHGLSNKEVSRFNLFHCPELKPTTPLPAPNLVLQVILRKYRTVTQIAWSVDNSAELVALLHIPFPPQITHFLILLSPHIPKKEMPYDQLDSIQDPRIVWLQVEENISRPRYTGILPTLAADRPIFRAHAGHIDGKYPDGVDDVWGIAESVVEDQHARAER